MPRHKRQFSLLTTGIISMNLRYRTRVWVKSNS